MKTRASVGLFRDRMHVAAMDWMGHEIHETFPLPLSCSVRFNGSRGQVSAYPCADAPHHILEHLEAFQLHASHIRQQSRGHEYPLYS